MLIANSQLKSRCAKQSASTSFLGDLKQAARRAVKCLSKNPVQDNTEQRHAEIVETGRYLPFW